MKSSVELNLELESFNRLWSGGFRTGYSDKRNQKGLEQYLTDNLRNTDCVLEIGCGGGQWTKHITPLVKKIICNDAKPASENHLYEYLDDFGINSEDVEFHQAKDFSLDYIPDNSLDFVFSYDVFCHISLSGQSLYLENLYNKCKSGCRLVIMYADPYKFALSEPNRALEIKTLTPEDLIRDCDSESYDGRWYWVGMENFLNLCKKYQYNVISEDLDIDKTNPITYFSKP